MMTPNFFQVSDPGRAHGDAVISEIGRYVNELLRNQGVATPKPSMSQRADLGVIACWTVRVRSVPDGLLA